MSNVGTTDPTVAGPSSDANKPPSYAFAHPPSSPVANDSSSENRNVVASPLNSKPQVENRSDATSSSSDPFGALDLSSLYGTSSTPPALPSLQTPMTSEPVSTDPFASFGIVKQSLPEQPQAAKEEEPAAVEAPAPPPATEQQPQPPPPPQSQPQPPAAAIAAAPAPQQSSPDPFLSTPAPSDVSAAAAAAAYGGVCPVVGGAPTPSPPERQRPPPQRQSDALVVPSAAAAAAPPVDHDPFGVFAAPAPAPQPAPAADDGGDDFWSNMGFAPAEPAKAAKAATAEQPPATTSSSSRGAPPEGAAASEPKKKPSTPLVLDASGLPVGGSTYKARVQSPSLGVIFYEPKKLKSSLYCDADDEAIKALGTRPVVAFVFHGSAALASGVEVGHVLLSVNGKPASDPDDATNLVRSMPRPLQLQFYVPPGDRLGVTLQEGMHMVKYDTIEKEAPLNEWEMKPKYVVVGGIVAKPWMMMMYRSKEEYGVAVRETMAGMKVSVKVKPFNLAGASIYLNDRSPIPIRWDSRPTSVYVTVLPERGYPIKISSGERDEMMPVLKGIRRVLEMQRDPDAALLEEGAASMKAGYGAGWGYPGNAGDNCDYDCGFAAAGSYSRDGDGGYGRDESYTE